MPKNFLCSLLGHNWGLETYGDQYSGEQITNVVCKRCKEATSDTQIFRRLTAVRVMCDACLKNFMDNQGHVLTLEELRRLPLNPGSKLAMTQIMVLTGHTRSKNYICDACYESDILK